MLWPNERSSGPPKDSPSCRKASLMNAFCGRSHQLHDRASVFPQSPHRDRDHEPGHSRPTSPSPLLITIKSNVAGLKECGYRAMPQVEQTLASYLFPGVASSLKTPALPTKPLHTTSTKGMRQQVRLVRVCTQSLCYRHTKLTCWSI